MKLVWRMMPGVYLNLDMTDISSHGRFILRILAADRVVFMLFCALGYLNCLGIICFGYDYQAFYLVP